AYDARAQPRRRAGRARGSEGGARLGGTGRGGDGEDARGRGRGGGGGRRCGPARGGRSADVARAPLRPGGGGARGGRRPPRGPRAVPSDVRAALERHFADEDRHLSWLTERLQSPPSSDVGSRTRR